MGSQGLSEIPTIDLTHFTTSDDFTSDKHREVARELAEKCRINGCVAITGHGLSSKQLKDTFNLSYRLFDLPYDQKMEAPHPKGTTPHRGYSGPGREHGAAKTALESTDEEQKKSYSKEKDTKETYEIGSDRNQEQYNIWLPEETLPGFRQATTEVFWAMAKSANAILEALIMSLDLTEEEATEVRALHSGHDNQLRLAYYPSVPKRRDSDHFRHGAHKDWSTFTLLYQDKYGGLEILDRESNQFLKAMPKEGVVYLTVGDILERISNGFYPATLHRVVLPEAADGDSVPARYSIPYFIVPDPDGTIAPQPSRVASDGKPNYEPVTFRSYSEKMFKAVRTD